MRFVSNNLSSECWLGSSIHPGFGNRGLERRRFCPSGKTCSLDPNPKRDEDPGDRKEFKLEQRPFLGAADRPLEGWKGREDGHQPLEESCLRNRASCNLGKRIGEETITTSENWIRNALIKVCDAEFLSYKSWNKLENNSATTKKCITKS